MTPDKPLVVVKWGDAWTAGAAYYHADKEYSTAKCLAVGFLVEENDEVVVIAQQYFEDADYRGLIVIPQSWVIEIEEYR